MATAKIQVEFVESGLAALLREWMELCPQACGQTEELRERTIAALEQEVRGREEAVEALGRAERAEAGARLSC